MFNDIELEYPKPQRSRISNKHITILTKILNGVTFKELSGEYNVGVSRIHQIKSQTLYRLSKADPIYTNIRFAVYMDMWEWSHVKNNKQSVLRRIDGVKRINPLFNRWVPDNHKCNGYDTMLKKPEMLAAVNNLVELLQSRAPL